MVRVILIFLLISISGFYCSAIDVAIQHDSEVVNRTFPEKKALRIPDG